MKQSSNHDKQVTMDSYLMVHKNIFVSFRYYKGIVYYKHLVKLQ